MRTHPYLWKRGNVWQWRRRFSRFSTENGDLKLSLGTSDRKIALILGRRITAASDQIMDQISLQQITPAQARAWLAHEIKQERAKIERLKFVRLCDSRDPDNDLAMDHAIELAWTHLKDQGLHAPDPVLEDNKTSMRVAQSLEIIRKDMISEARHNRLIREAREVAQLEGLSAYQRMQLMTLTIQAKAAAWKAQNRPMASIEAMAVEMAFSDEGLLGGSLHAPEPKATHEPASDEVRPQPADVPAPKTPPPDPSIISVIERMIALKREEGIEEKTLRQYQSFGQLFTLLSGITDVRLLRQTDASAFRAALHQMPQSWGKSPKDHTLTREELLARSASLPPDKVGLAVGTINRHLEHLAQVVEAAADEGISVDPRLKPVKLRKKDPERARDKRRAFGYDDLVQLFLQPIWTGSYSERYQTRKGNRIFKNGAYWAPLIGAYTGARREEIAGLSPKDITTEHGIPYFSFKDTEVRRVKNISSKRIVPIHSHLIELGIMEAVAQAKAQRSRDLFPDLREPKSGQHGRKVGRRMLQIVGGALGEDGAGLTFHSMRHYVQNALENHPSKISDKVIRDIIGHEGKDVHSKIYSKEADLKDRQTAIETLPRVM